MSRDVVIADCAEIKPCEILAERITILADHSQTGSYEVYLHDASEGAGPPPHSHPWDEAFFVIEGEVDFDCSGTAKKVKAGGFVHVPGGTTHAFRYASPTAKMLGFTSREGAAAMFRAVDRECGGASPDMNKLVGVLTRQQVTLAS